MSYAALLERELSKNNSGNSVATRFGDSGVAVDVKESLDSYPVMGVQYLGQSNKLRLIITLNPYTNKRVVLEAQGSWVMLFISNPDRNNSISGFSKVDVRKVLQSDKEIPAGAVKEVVDLYGWLRDFVKLDSKGIARRYPVLMQ